MRHSQRQADQRLADKGRPNFPKLPPDYTQRGPWGAKCYLMVAAVMAVLAVAERSR